MVAFDLGHEVGQAGLQGLALLPDPAEGVQSGRGRATGDLAKHHGVHEQLVGEE